MVEKGPEREGGTKIPPNIAELCGTKVGLAGYFMHFWKLNSGQNELRNRLMLEI